MTQKGGCVTVMTQLSLIRLRHWSGDTKSKVYIRAKRNVTYLFVPYITTSTSMLGLMQNCCNSFPNSILGSSCTAQPPKVGSVKHGMASKSDW